MKRLILCGSALVCAAVAACAQNTPAAAPAPDSGTPERQEERAYVRRFSIGISAFMVPTNLFPKASLVEDHPTFSPPTRFETQFDPNSSRVSYGFTAHAALNERWTVGISPALRKFSFGAVTHKFEGVDNSSTFLDERADTMITEKTTGRYLDVPVLARHYSKNRHESGPRWFLEAGPSMRITQKLTTSRVTIPPKLLPVSDTTNLAHRKNSLGAVAGFGGQFIDDFGIRIIPEVRYTYWFSKPFDSNHATSRQHQIEIVFSLSF
ncbi:MAG: outer membrane beta-barrel protein [Acidobacteriota bacterium]